MQTSKLLNLLSTFSTKEMKSFHSFLISPFHNTNEELIRFFDYLKSNHPHLSSSKLSKEVIFKYLYPNKIYKDKQIRYLMSHLLKLGKQFLLIKNLESNKVEQSLQLLNEFNKRKLNKHYQQTRNELALYLSKNQTENTKYFLDEMKLIDLEAKYYLLQNNRLFDNKIQEGSNALDSYYVLKKLKYTCSILNRQVFFKEDYDLNLPDYWTAWIKQNDYWSKKTIQIYTKAFLVLKFPNKLIYFENYLKLLTGKTSGVSHDDLRELFLYAINYCLRKMREGEKNYVEKALTLYIKGIKTGALLENGLFSPQSFSNVIKVALRLQKYNWIERFIKEYSHFLPPASKENTLQYNLAELNCYKKDFNTALRLLSKVKFVDISYQLGSRIMLSKIYYELKEETALLSLLSSFMMFLKRNKQLSESLRKSCLNFCNLLFLIIRDKMNGIENQINNATLLADRNWLLEKVAERRNEYQ